MVHLDTCLLIAFTKPNDPHAEMAERLVNASMPLGASACAWTEYKSRPTAIHWEKILHRALSGGIVPFDEAAASLAGELFHLTGSRRRTRLDTMIAATAILSGAELATTNPADFEPFVPHGLKLHGF
jgi:predicted nucleic acid-binding protein